MLPHVIYWAGALADWYTTKRGIQRGAVEANPIMAWTMHKWGRDWGITVLKFGVWGWLFYSDMPPGAYYTAGGVQMLAAIGNRLGWWTWLRNKIKR